MTDQSLLFDIIKKGSIELLETFLKLNNDINLNELDEEGWTALMYAAIENPSLVQPLIDAGADVNLQSPSRGGWTALMCAARYHPEVVQPLIDAGADLNLQNTLGWTALMLAAKHHPEVVQPLIDAGADVNLQNAFGSTALMYAARHFPEVVQPLIDAGADPNKQNIPEQSSLTALMYAAKYQPEAICPLIDAGADTEYAINNLTDENEKELIRNNMSLVLTIIQDDVMYQITPINSEYCNVKLLGAEIDETRENVRYVKTNGNMELIWSSLKLIQKV